MKEWKHKVLEQGDKVIRRDAIHKKWAAWLPRGRLPSGVDPKQFWKQWEEAGSTSQKSQEKQDQDNKASQNASRNARAALGLPSWVTRINNARFDIFRHPGMDMVKMGRKNADPLVGNLEDGTSIYRAAQLTKVDLKVLRFRKREIQPDCLGHYSLYVKGFM